MNSLALTPLHSTVGQSKSIECRVHYGNFVTLNINLVSRFAEAEQIQRKEALDLKPLCLSCFFEPGGADKA